MSDADLRALERRFRETGSKTDEAAYLAAKTRNADPFRWDRGRSSVEGHPLAGSTLLLVVRGMLTDPDDGGVFFPEIEDLPSRGWTRLLFDFSGLKDLNSHACGRLAKLRDALAVMDGTLALVNVPRKVQIVVEMLGFESLLPMYASVEDALRSRG